MVIQRLGTYPTGDSAVQPSQALPVESLLSQYVRKASQTSIVK